MNGDNSYRSCFHGPTAGGPTFGTQPARLLFMNILNRVPVVLQIGANAHSDDAAFTHDPVPRLIGRGWGAILLEPQSHAAASLRVRYRHLPQISVVEAAFCVDDASQSMPLWFVNGTRTLGANESDVRCVGKAISGTASFSRAHVLQHQRWYRYTPSQCAACSRLLGRALPPTCMRRVYLDNVEVANVPCATYRHLFPARNRSSGGQTSSELLGADAVVVDVEGADDKVVSRYLDLATEAATPSVLVYEHAHLRPQRRAALASRLRAVGLVQYRASEMKAPPGTMANLHARHWTAMRHVLARVNANDNAVWVRRSSQATHSKNATVRDLLTH